MLFGKMIKQLREEQGLLQRQLAAQLDIDTPQYSKLERGERMPKKEQIGQIATLLNTDEKRLRTLWLADKICKITEYDKDIQSDAIETVLGLLNSPSSINCTTDSK